MTISTMPVTGGSPLSVRADSLPLRHVIYTAFRDNFPLQAKAKGYTPRFLQIVETRGSGLAERPETFT